MRCEDWLELMEEAVDGEVKPQDLLRLQEHLRGCQECARQYGEIQREMKLYAGFDRGLGSTSELWDGVLAKIREADKEQRFSLVKLKRWWTAGFEGYRFSPILTAALVLISIAGTIVVMKYRDFRSNGTARDVVMAPQPSPHQSTIESPSKVDMEERSAALKGQSSTVIPEHKEGPQGTVRGNAATSVSKRAPTAPRQPSVTQLVQEAENKYLTAIAMLEKDFRRKSSHLDPNVRARLEETIAAIDHSIEETRLVVNKNPEDPVAVQYMLTAYAKKVDVLKELANL